MPSAVSRRTLYMVLGQPPSATVAQLHAAYKRLAIQHHPDKGGSTAVFAEITAAWAVLKDNKARQLYDRKLLLLGKPCAVCKGKGTLTRTRSFTLAVEVECGQCGGTGQTA